MLPAKRGKPDYIDKMVAAMIGEAEATPEMAEQIEKLERTWSLLHNYSRLTVVGIMKANMGVKSSQAYKLIRDAYALFGNINETTSKGKKALYVEHFKRLAEAAEASGDIRTAGMQLARAAKIEGAFDAETTPGMNPEEWLVPVEIEFTTDKQVLIDSQRGTEDTDYEEVTDEPER